MVLSISSSDIWYLDFLYIRKIMEIYSKLCLSHPQILTTIEVGD